MTAAELPPEYPARLEPPFSTHPDELHKLVAGTLRRPDGGPRDRHDREP